VVMWIMTGPTSRGFPALLSPPPPAFYSFDFCSNRRLPGTYIKTAGLVFSRRINLSQYWSLELPGLAQQDNNDAYGNGQDLVYLVANGAR
jgi:hypothetical protein